jgi:Sec-independent protein translocase protein TatA
MNKLIKRLSLSAATLCAGFLLFPAAASALTISPPLIDHQLNPGDTVLETIKIFNEDPYQITVYPLLRNFTAGEEENGEPVFLPPEVEDNGTGLADWISLDTQPITIGPKERTNLAIAINVPRDAEPGGHYGAVILSTEPPSNRPGVGVSQQLGSLLMVRVSGEVKEDGRIAEFSITNKKVWHNYLPINFMMRFENSGNTHLRPAGNIFITNWLGRQVASLNVNPDFRGVLPRSIRKFTADWTKGNFSEGQSELEREWKNFALGPHKATVVVYYGNQNKMVLDELEFTVWPWRLMAIGGGILVLLVLLLIMGFKNYKKNLMRQLEAMAGKGKPSKSDRQKQADMEAELRAKLEKELREKLEKEMKANAGEPPAAEDKPDDKPPTDLPPELQA